MGNLRNRIRSYTAWPLDRDARIEAAKIDVGALIFFGRLDIPVPDDIEARALKAMDVLEAENVPERSWEE